MVPSELPTHELMKECMPTRQEKQRLAKFLGLGESLMYKWCEDPEGSGRPNPLDQLEVLLDHARLNHPHVVFAITHRIVQANARSIGRGATAMPVRDLLSTLQPAAEKETAEALHALSGAIRAILMGGTADLSSLLREVEDAERELKRARVMIAAAVDAAGIADES